MNQNDEKIKTTPASVAATPQQAGEAPARRDPWWWVERCVWTEAMLSRLASGEPVSQWLARHGFLSLKELHDWKRTIVAIRTH